MTLKKAPIEMTGNEIRELTFNEIEEVSGGLVSGGLLDDDFPHGLGCGCRSCRENDPDRAII